MFKEVSSSPSAGDKDFMCCLYIQTFYDGIYSHSHTVSVVIHTQSLPVD